MVNLRLWYHKWGVWLALFVFGAAICSAGIWASLTWGNDWPVWLAMLLGFVNLAGAIGLILPVLKEGVTPAYMLPLLLLYYLGVLLVIFVPAYYLFL